MRSGPSLFTLFTLAALGCSPQASTTTADETPVVRQEIEAANARFLESLQKGDTATVAANYATDAVVMMPNEPAWRGENVKSGFKSFMGTYTLTGGGVKTEDVMVAGDLAVETGSFEWTLQPKKGKPVTDKGKYLTVWKRQADGSWKIVRDINNTDLAHHD